MRIKHDVLVMVTIMVASIAGCVDDAMIVSHNNTSSSVCSNDDECLKGENCIKGECVAKGSDVGECSDGENCKDDTCDGGKCSTLPEGSCVYDADCKDDKKICRNSACVDKPNTQGGGTGDGKCHFDGDCENGLSCERNSGECKKSVALGENCNDDVICQSGECILGTCQQDETHSDDDGLKNSDKDGDTISDLYDRCDNDTDNDQKPDCEDEDSDGDTIPDRVEGGTKGDLSKRPLDSDGDKIYDFMDTDSDDNGIPDSVEAGQDPSNPVNTNGDDTPDYIDFDNDGDGASDEEEIVGVLNANKEPGRLCGTSPCSAGTSNEPWDTNNDGIPDYMSPDSDGDTIPDSIEERRDSNNDGELDRYSLDSDGDTIPDKDERNSNGEIAKHEDSYCFRFVDCDKDGLHDGIEYQIGSSFMTDDTDQDGAPDMVEYAAGTKLNDPKDNPVANGDFVFIAPYEEDTTPEKQTLSFETSVQTVDIYFSIDQSGSMYDEIYTLQKKIPSMIDRLSCGNTKIECVDNTDCDNVSGNGVSCSASGDCICSESKRCIVNPSKGEGCFADMWTGVGWWGDLNMFQNALSLQGDPGETSKVLKDIPDLGASENCIQPSACVSGGTQYCTNSDTINCYHGSDERVGCVGYRPGAIKILIQCGDEENAEYVSSGPFTIKNAVYSATALKEKQIRLIGLWGEAFAGWGWGSPTEALDGGVKQLVCEAGSCETGVCAKDCQNPTQEELDGMYLAKIDNEDIEQHTINMVRKLTKGMQLTITSGKEDIDQDASKLIEGLKVNVTDEHAQGRNCTKVINIVPGSYEGISKLAPGTSVCFDVIPVQKQNIFKPDSQKPVLKKARVKVMGDGSILNSGVAYFVIPPKVEEGGGVIIN